MRNQKLNICIKLLLVPNEPKVLFLSHSAVFHRGILSNYTRHLIQHGYRNRKRKRLENEIIRKNLGNNSRNSIPEIFNISGFQGQGMYHFPKNPGSKSSIPRRNHTRTMTHSANYKKINDKKKPICFNCGEIGHYYRDCKKPRNLVNNFSQILRKYPNVQQKYCTRFVRRLRLK